ncbi:MAG: type II secretion system F family protein [Acidimicrobiia bacterium]
MTDGFLLAIAVAGTGLAAAGAAALVVRPAPRLAPRVRPYTVVTRTRVRGDADIAALLQPSHQTRGGWMYRLVAPPLLALAARVGRVVERREDESLALSLRQAGYVGVSPADYRTGVVTRLALFGAAGVGFGIVVFHSPLATLGLAACGAVFGASRSRGRIDRAIRDRAERIRLELYTVNQLLAMNVRTGAGPIQAVQRLIDRGSGVVVEELRAVLTAVRRGTAEPAAFRRAAELTPEPAAARTYKLFAAGAERGVDLAAGLRALSEDLRDARREEIRKSATRRRAAMLVPTIAVLAPVMLLFIAAPLPSIVFGSR